MEKDAFIVQVLYHAIMKLPVLDVSCVHFFSKFSQPCRECSVVKPTPTLEPPKIDTTNTLSTSDTSPVKTRYSKGDKVTTSILKKIEALKEESDELNGLAKTKNSAHYRSLEMLSSRAMARAGKQAFDPATSPESQTTTDAIRPTPKRRETYNGPSPSTKNMMPMDSDANMKIELSLSESFGNINRTSLSRYAVKKEKLLISTAGLSAAKSNLPSPQGPPVETPVNLKQFLSFLMQESKCKLTDMALLELNWDSIDLSTLVGKSNPESLDLIVDRMVWWARQYEQIKHEANWNSIQAVPKFHPNDLSAENDTANDEIFYRTLDIFYGI
jgi:hypothetical protein